MKKVNKIKTSQLTNRSTFYRMYNQKKDSILEFKDAMQQRKRERERESCV